MDKIVIRNKLTECIGSYLVDYANNIKMSLSIACDSYKEIALKSVLRENVSYEELYEEYLNLCNGNESKYFNYGYLVNESYAVVITDHIYLYHYVKSDQDFFNLPWIYPDGKIFLGDTWWFTDEEILDDLVHLNTYGFLDKYKGI